MLQLRDRVARRGYQKSGEDGQGQVSPDEAHAVGSLWF